MDAATNSDESADATGAQESGDDDTIIDDVLVEEISIDGMCGVY